MNGRDVAFAGLFAALTAVGAQISIPLGEVPITLQVLFVLLSGTILGARLGAISQLVYIIAGAVGFPVFAGLSGGAAVLYGPTGGYLMAFPIAAGIAGFLAEKRRLEYYILGSLMAIGVIYLLGWFRLGLFLGDLRKAFVVGVLPFIAVDLIKATVAVAVTDRVRKALSL